MITGNQNVGCGGGAVRGVLGSTSHTERPLRIRRLQQVLRHRYQKCPFSIYSHGIF